MIAFEAILTGMAEDAGIKVPASFELGEYDANEFPHWHVYCMTQLGAPMPHPSAPRDNAKIIAQIPEDKIRLVTFDDLMELGCVYGNSYGYN